MTQRDFGAWVTPRALAELHVPEADIFPERYLNYTETRPGEFEFLYPIPSYRYIETDARMHPDFVAVLEPLTQARCRLLRKIARQRGIEVTDRS